MSCIREAIVSWFKRGAAQVAFQLGAYGCLVVLAFAVPLIAVQTARGLRLRVTGAALLLLVFALPLVAWGIGLTFWFL